MDKPDTSSASELPNNDGTKTDINDDELNEPAPHQLEAKESMSSSYLVVVERDSEWTGLGAVRKENSEQLAEQSNAATELPIFVLFPNLGNVHPQREQLLDRKLSTTEITRMLVELGEKPDFSSLKMTDKMHVSENSSLDPIPEKSENVLWSLSLDASDEARSHNDCTCEKKSYHELNLVASDMLITDRGRTRADNKSPPCTRCVVCDKKCDAIDRKTHSDDTV